VWLEVLSGSTPGRASSRSINPGATLMRVGMLGLAGFLSLTSASLGAVLTTEEQIRLAIIGNTVSGTEDGKPYTEYFLPDGHLRGVDPEGPYSGEWRISGRRLCERYFDEGSSSDWECMGVEIVGSRFAWIVDGERYEARRIAGNPNNL
jgi:hypothetical protein